MLGWIARDIDFEEAVEGDSSFLSLLREALGEFQAVERMQAGEVAGNEFGFVRLQVPDEVPFQSLACELWNLSKRLLRGIFTEYTLAGGDGRGNRLHRLIFTYGDQFHLLRRPPGARRRGVDLSPQAFKICGDHTVHWIHVYQYNLRTCHKRESKRVQKHPFYPVSGLNLSTMSLIGARKISSLLSALKLSELGMPPDVARLPEIVAAWTQAVGPVLAEQVRPIRYTEGKLLLRASSPVWVSKVRHLHETLTQELRQQPLFRELRGLEVRAAPRQSAKKENRSSAARELSTDTRQLLNAISNEIADPDLRAALARLARKPNP